MDEIADLFLMLAQKDGENKVEEALDKVKALCEKFPMLDICCGSGAFLVTAMGKMFKEAARPEDIEYIRKNNA